MHPLRTIKSDRGAVNGLSPLLSLSSRLFLPWLYNPFSPFMSLNEPHARFVSSLTPTIHRPDVALRQRACKTFFPFTKKLGMILHPTHTTNIYTHTTTNI